MSELKGAVEPNSDCKTASKREDMAGRWCESAAEGCVRIAMGEAGSPFSPSGLPRGGGGGPGSGGRVVQVKVQFIDELLFSAGHEGDARRVGETLLRDRRVKWLLSQRRTEVRCRARAVGEGDKLDLEPYPRKGGVTYLMRRTVPPMRLAGSGERSSSPLADRQADPVQRRRFLLPQPIARPAASSSEPKAHARPMGGRRPGG